MARNILPRRLEPLPASSKSRLARPPLLQPFSETPSKTECNSRRTAAGWRGRRCLLHLLHGPPQPKQDIGPISLRDAGRCKSSFQARLKRFCICSLMLCHGWILEQGTKPLQLPMKRLNRSHVGFKSNPPQQQSEGADNQRGAEFASATSAQGSSRVHPAARLGVGLHTRVPTAPLQSKWRAGPEQSTFPSRKTKQALGHSLREWVVLQSQWSKP